VPIRSFYDLIISGLEDFYTYEAAFSGEGANF